jgi:L-ascorbate metabolism protein UlaG (beta-lactamase superfamily)
MDLTWYGHSTWLVEVGTTSLLIDPFFQNPHTSHTSAEIADPDYLLVTHGHQDHIADAGAFDGATVVATPELSSFLRAEMGLEETIAGSGMNVGGTVQCDDAYVTMTAANHSNGFASSYERSAGPPAGFLISDSEPRAGAQPDATSFYHAGDTALISDMRSVIGEYLAPTAAALPIGDHFTMGPTQAAIALGWLGVDRGFPMHYDTFGPIETDPQEFVDAAAAHAETATVEVLAGDETVRL